MDDLSRKWRSIDWKGLQKSARKMQASTASALKDLVMTDLENNVRAATADTSWGASGTDLMAICQATYSREDYALIMSIVWQRLTSSRWRCVYKGLDLLRHLIMHGSARCAEEARSAVTHIQALENFRYIDPKSMKDEGANVRAKAQLVVAILTDSELLEEEREKSKALRAKLAGGTSMSSRPGGMSSDDYRYGNATANRPSVPTTSATGRYAGYDDDDDVHTTPAYDENPNSFASKFNQSNSDNTANSHMANVDDLLGGDPTPAWDEPAVSPEKVEAKTAQPTYAAADTDDLFSTLAISDEKPAAVATVAQPDAKLPTSLLIQKLAAEKASQNEKRVEASGNTQGEPSQQNGVQGAVSQTADDIFADTPVQPSNAPPVATRAPLTRKKDNDPFGDLLSTAKQSGVL